MQRSRHSLLKKHVNIYYQLISKLSDGFISGAQL